MKLEFEAIGTAWEIETPAALDAELKVRLLERVRHFDASFSRFRPDSVVTRAAAAPEGGCFEFPDNTHALFDLYDRLHEVSSGAVDPLIGRDLELLGYDSTYSLTVKPELAQAGASAQRPAWSRDVVRKGTLLATRRPLVIDVAAAGKGYLVDALCGALSDAGCTEFVVDGGGDLRHSGKQGIRVGLEHPFDPTRIIGVANVHDRALAASATNRRAWGKGLHHVIDGRTGLPVRDVVATWVVAEDAMVADGVATALFFKGTEALAQEFRCSCVRMFADGRVELSRNFDGEHFLPAPASNDALRSPTDPGELNGT